jgi:glycerophosphoryl diester phosphodiesterase
MSSRPLIVVGHRGAKGLALENTAASVNAAIDYGVDMVEIDLRVSRDRRVVLFHDENVMARDLKQIDIHDYTHKELLEYFPDMLTFEDLLKVVDRRCRIMLEFKEAEAIEPTVELLHKAFQKGWQPSDFMFASFKFEMLEHLHRLVPEIDVVVLDRWSSVRATHHARKIGTAYISMDQRYLWWGVIRNLSKHYKLFCYPNHKLIHIKHAKPNKWAKYGLYGVITDYPNLFRAKQK